MGGSVRQAEATAATPLNVPLPILDQVLAVLGECLALGA
jgi:hypothetical protein